MALRPDPLPDPRRYLPGRGPDTLVGARCGLRKHFTSAGFPDAAGLDRDRIGVVIGNTLGGEFSRASSMRLRWPYVRKTLAEAMVAEGLDSAVGARLLASFERSYKAPFPEPTDESLSGSLANVIAGRICNYFGLHGGGYTVDGACASSLLAVITACHTLSHDDVDLVLAGGSGPQHRPVRTGRFRTTRRHFRRRHARLRRRAHWILAR